MKKIRFIIAAFAILSVSTVVQAQKHKERSEDEKKEMTAKMEKNRERLQLTAEQEISFKAINKKYRTEMKALKNAESDRRDKFAKGKDLRERKNQEMKALLSAKQYQIYLDIQQERKETRRAMRKE